MGPPTRARSPPQRTGSFTQGTLQHTAAYSPPLRSCPTPPSTGPSPSVAPFEYAGAATHGRDPRPFILTSFLSTAPRSDSWHRIGQNFAFAYICTYLALALGRCLPSPLPALSSAGAAISQPYLSRGRYQASLGHRHLFPTVSPAHTLVRRGGTLRLCPHSAGSTIPRLWPTGSSSGSLPSITTRWFSSSPSDLTSR